MLSFEEIMDIGRQPSNMSIATIWNLYFDSAITGWDLDFSVGRNWVRLRQLQRRIILAEGWHNQEGDLAYFLRFLSERRGIPCGFWAETVAKISVLGSCLARVMADGKQGGREYADLACVSGDFSGILAGMYLKRMGFPIGKLVCCCNENNNVWELVHMGVMRTDGVCVPTQTPEADMVLPEGLEHLIFLLGGVRGAVDYARATYMGLNYEPGEELLKKMRQELYVSVVSDGRVSFAAAGIFQSTQSVVSIYDALCFAGVQDYWAKGGTNRMCLLLSQRSPALDPNVLAEALKISVKELIKNLGR